MIENSNGFSRICDGCCNSEQSSNGFSRVLAISLSIPINPPRSTMQGSTRILKKRDGTTFIGKPTSSNAKKAKKLLKTYLMPYAPIVPLKGALFVSIIYNFEFNKTEKKSNRKKGIIPHNKRPDSDNLMKGLFDVLSECNYWNDDSQVSSLQFEKNYSANPLLSINIYNIIA